MKDLKCGLTACKHNKGYCCCAKSIDVDKHADCLTYTPVTGKKDMEAANDFKAVGKSGGSSCLFASFSFQHSENRLDQNFHILAQRPIVDILGIQTDDLLEVGDFASPADLP